MESEEPPSKKRKMRNSIPSSPSMNVPSPSPKKKIKVKKFAQENHLTDLINVDNIKQEKIDEQEDLAIPEVGSSDVMTLTPASIQEDDEIWIVQCPLGMNPESLIGESLSFSDSSMFTDSASLQKYEIETVISPKKFQCILPKDNSTDYQICNLKTNGMLIVTENVDVGTIADTESEDVKETFILPPDVKLRNPHILPGEICALKPKSTKLKRKSQH